MMTTSKKSSLSSRIHASSRESLLVACFAAEKSIRKFSWKHKFSLHFEEIPWLKIGQSFCNFYFKLLQSALLITWTFCRFVLNLCVESELSDDGEPAMIAFHFKTKFNHHRDGNSSVIMTCKRGPNGWVDVEEIDNTWIDDDGKDVINCTSH